MPTTEPNPFEPEETREQQDARIGRMIRDNVDERMHAQSPDSTLSKECYWSQTDTDCSLCTQPGCEHYCHSSSYQLWRATDDMVAFVLLMDTRSILHGKEDIVKQFAILKEYSKKVMTIMDSLRNQPYELPSR